MSIDDYVINLHQQVVDALQRRPVQLAKVVTAVYIAASAIDLVNRPDVVLITLYPILAVLMLLSCASERWFAQLNDAKLTRLLLFALLAGEVMSNALKAQVNFASFINSVCVTSFYYFAACRPPKPPKRKEKTFLNPALKGNV